MADRQLCFPRSDATCAAQLVGADRDFRNLLRNGCLSSLREVDYELEYLARCQVSKPLSRPILLAPHNCAMTPLRPRRDVASLLPAYRCQEAGATATIAAAANAPPILLADGVRCGPEALTDTAEVRTLLLQAGFSE